MLLRCARPSRAAVRAMPQRRLRCGTSSRVAAAKRSDEVISFLRSFWGVFFLDWFLDSVRWLFSAAVLL